MSWTEYYDILKEHGSFRKAPKKEMEVAKRGNPNTPQDAMRIAQDKFNEEKYGCRVITHVHDEDCPKCGFPETIIVRRADNGQPIEAYCSKECGWRKELKLKKTTKIYG